MQVHPGGNYTVRFQLGTGTDNVNKVKRFASSIRHGSSHSQRMPKVTLTVSGYSPTKGPKQVVHVMSIRDASRTVRHGPSTGYT